MTSTKPQWEVSWRTDPRARSLADRHYSRQTIGARGFVPPGRCLVLIGANRKAYWVTSWPFAEYVKHAWPGAWMCSAFRNEGEGPLASVLIRQAVAATRVKWPAVPSVGAITRGLSIDVAVVTFVNEDKIRHKRQPGRVFMKAGFVPIGRTKGGLIALGLPVDRLPAAMEPRMTQQTMFKTTLTT